MASVEEIDQHNILEATKISMRRAVKKLTPTPTPLIIDGNIDLNLSDFPSKGVLKGDQQSFSIAAASIMAKIHRDRYMQFLSFQLNQLLLGKHMEFLIYTKHAQNP